MISLSTSALNITLSLDVSPTLIFPAAPALRYALPSTCKSPLIYTSLKAVTVSVNTVVLPTLNVPVSVVSPFPLISLTYNVSQCCSPEPKLYCSCSAGMKSLLTSAINVTMSFELSPMRMSLPVPALNQMLPFTCRSPSTSMSFLAIMMLLKTAVSEISNVPLTYISLSVVSPVTLNVDVRSRGPVTVSPLAFTNVV